MAVNLDRPHRWKADIAESVRAYNRWFLASAPKAFREQRQLEGVGQWLSKREYDRIPAGNAEDPASMPPGSFSFRMNVDGWVDEHGIKTVKIPSRT